MQKRGFSLAIMLVFAAGCSPDASDPLAVSEVGPEGGVAASMHVSTAMISGLATPEAALYDEASDVYLISNLGDPFSSALDGFIIRYDPKTGTSSRFIENLISPTGMTILRDVLYVVDRDGVKMFNRVTGAFLGTIALPSVSVSDGFIFYNDICGGPDGRLYVTGTNLNAELAAREQSAIFMIRDGRAELFATDVAVAPNGCIRQGAKHVIFTSFTEAGGIYRINSSGHISTVVDSDLILGGNDSAVQIGNVWYVTSWAADGVYRVSPNGKHAELIATGIDSPADMGYDPKRNRLIVPSPFDNSVTFVSLGKHP